MARCRFVRPESVRLFISDGDWLDVKKELNAGEQHRVFTRLVKTFTAGHQPELNPEQVGKTQALEYIVDWSLCDEKEHRVAFSAEALDAIDPGTYQEIIAAVEKHHEAAEQARDERKNGKDGKDGLIATLPSADSSPAGPTTTSSH